MSNTDEKAPLGVLPPNGATTNGYNALHLTMKHEPTSTRTSPADTQDGPTPLPQTLQEVMKVVKAQFDSPTT